MPKKIDLTNNKIGWWTVIREATKEEKENRPGAYWVCQCDCGNIKIINGQSLRKGESKSCGCMTSSIISTKNKQKAEDLTGKIFGRLTVIERDYEIEKQKTQRGSTYWICQCECGNQISVLRSSLVSGKTKSCGCIRKETSAKFLSEISKNNFIDETGHKYGKLTVIQKADSNKNGVYWLCKCDCGNYTTVSGQSLRTGNTSSCGCLNQSKGEMKIEELLTNNHIVFTKEYPIYINDKRLRYDFAIFKNNILQYFIEFDGKQHFEPNIFFGGKTQFNQTKINDNSKNQWCKENNVPLIRIPYTHYNNLDIADLILDTSKFIYG